MIIIGLTDNSVDCKTGEILYGMIQERISNVEEFHQVSITGFTSDSEGDSKKARRLLKVSRPDLIVLPCYAHQVNQKID